MMKPKNPLDGGVIAVIAILGILTAAAAVAREAPQIIVKYRSAAAAQKALNAARFDPAALALGPIQRAAATFARFTRTSFPAENFITYTLPDTPQAQAALDRLRGDPAVEYAQPNYIRHIDGAPAARTARIGAALVHLADRAQSLSPDDSAYPSQWNLQAVQAPQAWNIETGDTNVLIGFVDTGIDFFHKDFFAPDGRLGSIHVNPAEDINHDGIFEPWSKDTSELVNGIPRTGDLDGIDEDGNGFVDDVIGYDFVDQASPNFGDWSVRDAVPYDENGHGTAIAGIMAAQTNNAIGIAGVAFHCRLLPLRAFDAAGNGEDDDIAAAIVYAADFSSADGARVRVLNCSFGDVVNSPLMHDAIRYANDKGIVVVCSSGNNGGSGAHYPSDYPECVSVGASNQYDGVVPTSGGGNALALVAPGANIPATAPGSAYTVVSGTSAAAPHAAAAAALILSHTPALSPADVRGILETSADDIDHDGWDARAGAGRLNIYRALQSFAASIAISSPRQDTGVAASNVVITGTAAAPFFSFYQVYIGAGADPASWLLLRDTVRRQALNDTLAVWDASGAPDSSYVARLVVTETDGQTVESRSRFFLERASPAATYFRIFDAMDGDKHALVVAARSDQETRFTVYYRQKNSGGQYMAKPQADRLSHDHYVELTDGDLSGGTPYDLYAEFQNAAGAATRIDSNGAPFTAVRSAEAFPVTNFVQKPYSLPAAFFLNRTADFYKDNTVDIAAKDMTNGEGVLKIFAFGNGKFTARDSFAGPYDPRGIGATRGDGLLQIWAQRGYRNILFSQAAPNGSPLQRAALVDTTANTQIAAAMADVDGDGKDELIAISGSDILVYKYQNGAYPLLARLPDPAPLSPSGNPKQFSAPAIATGDFNDNGRMDILAGDGDADFYIYEYNPSSKGFDLIFQDDNNAQDAYVAAGDFNGDGVVDFVEGFHSSLNWNADREYDTPCWTFKAFTFGAGKFNPVWTQRFFGVKPPSTYTSGVAAGDLNGKPGDELFINAFPNTYIYTWDASAGSLAPLQYFPFGITNTALIADFDGNGVNEAGFNTGSETDFFEYSAAPAGPATPVNFAAAPLDSTVARLSWNTVAGADHYVILRGAYNVTDTVIVMDSVATATNAFYTDTTLQSRVHYAYAVAAVNAAGERSRATPLATAYPHPKVRLDRVSVRSTAAISAHFSGALSSAPVSVASFALDSTAAPSSAIVQSDSSLALVFAKPLAAGGHVLRVLPFPDRFGEPVDSSALAFIVQPPARQDSLYILKFAVPDAHDLMLTFSCALDSAAAANPANYDLEPSGTVIAARRDSADHTVVRLTLDPLTPIGAFGKDWTVHVTNLTSACGAIVQGAGSTIGVMLFKEDLSAMFVYPNPCRLGADGHLTFANLTPQADITIFTPSGAQIATVSAQQANGGAVWDLRDRRGEQINSGVYIYRATGKNSAGNDVEPKLGKFAVVR